MIKVVKDGSFPFWTMNDKDKISFSPLRMSQFMSHYGWGWYQFVPNRGARRDLFHNDNAILKLHSDVTIKKWLLDFLDGVDEEEFLKGCFQTPNKPSKFNILDAVIGISTDFWKRVLTTLNAYSSERYVDTIPLQLFRDSDGVSHIRFRNGVVRITSDDITLIDKDEVVGEGLIWESELLPHDITLQNGSNQKGLFEKFVELAFHQEMYGSKKPTFSDNFELKTDQYRAWRESYGYLLHPTKRLDAVKCPIYIDSEGNSDDPEGRNGKSLLASGIKHYKRWVEIDGRGWHNDSRFEFSSVTPETKFILINDVKHTFKFSRLFNLVTDSMTIEGKGTNKKEIPAEKSPKLALCTNEVISGTGGSYRGRQHIVEFGNYWNRVERLGEKVSDSKHIGKQLYHDFDTSDWDDFYNYGFKCIQEFLTNGLREAANQNYELKSLIRKVEGRSDDGFVTKWMTEWVKTTRLENDYHKSNGISEAKLFLQFQNDIPELASSIPGGWDRKRFSLAFWHFIQEMKGYHFNEQLSYKGNSKSDRRLQITDTSGKQVPHIRITTDFDDEWKLGGSPTNQKPQSSKSNLTPTDDDDDEDTMKFFEGLAKS